MRSKSAGRKPAEYCKLYCKRLLQIHTQRNARAAGGPGTFRRIERAAPCVRVCPGRSGHGRAGNLTRPRDSEHGDSRISVSE